MTGIVNIALNILLFAVVFVVVAFGIVWGPTLWAPVNETLTPAKTCTGECEYPAAGDADGGLSWQRVALWGPVGAPDLDNYPGVKDAEPMIEFGTSSRIRRAGASVGRIQFLLDAGGRDVKTACTGFLIAPGTVLTAAHCTEVEGKTAPVKLAAIRFGFLQQTQKGEGTFFKLDPATIERAPAASPADFLVVKFQAGEAAKLAAAGLAPVALSAQPLVAGDDLFIVGHPLAVAQMALRAHCRVQTQTPGDDKNAGKIIHTCGTAPGVSGAPIFADASGAVVGIHVEAHEKVENEMQTVGFGVPLAAIAKRSPTVAALLAPAAP